MGSRDCPQKKSGSIAVGKFSKFNAEICAFWQAECNNLRSVNQLPFVYYPFREFNIFSRYFMCTSFPGNKRSSTPISPSFAADAAEYVLLSYLHYVLLLESHFLSVKAAT